MLNISLIGLGRMGSKYFRILKKNDNFNLIKILGKKNYIQNNSSAQFYTNKKRFFLKNKKKNNAYIIDTQKNTLY